MQNSMRRRVVHIVSSLLIWPFLLAPAFAGGKSLLVGKWVLDVGKFTVPNPPKRVTLVLADAAGGKYRMTVSIVDDDGTKRYGATTFKPDGTPSPTVGNADYSVVSMTMPSRRIWVMGGAFQGHPANTRVWSLSDDGRHMIETVVWHSPDGTPHTRVDFWNRVE
jgi:hypothetical protein